jgi:hypothetical protein
LSSTTVNNGGHTRWLRVLNKLDLMHATSSGRAERDAAPILNEAIINRIKTAFFLEDQDGDGCITTKQISILFERV